LSRGVVTSARMLRRCVAVAGELRGACHPIVRAYCAGSPPDQRVFLRKMVPIDGEEGPADLRAMQYNVLAPEFAFGKYTEYCPRDALAWEYRSKQLLTEVAHYNPDLLFMQEVENYDVNFREQFGELGYEGKFKSTTDRSNKVGVAVLYKRDRFEQTDELNIEFNDITNDFTWQKDNVATALLLRQRADGRALCASTAHIFWNPRRLDIKMKQSHFLCEKLEAFMRTHAPVISELPLLLAGDFNSKPSSEVYKFLKEGFIERPEGCLYTPRLDHNLKLASAFTSAGEPASNFTMDFQGCLDYIWHTGHFQPTALIDAVNPVDKDLFSEIRYLPNRLLPSDHTCLVTDFSWASVSK